MSSYGNLINFQLGDIRSTSLDEKVAAVISLFHVVSYLVEDRDIKLAFKNVRNHLNVNGLFFFDFWYKPAVINGGPEYREKEMENSHFHVFRKSIPDHSLDKNLIVVNFEVEVTDKKTQQKEYLAEKHPMRYLEVEEINSFLKDSGFEMVLAEEWLIKEKPSEKTWGVAILARAI
ncbi:MAG: hypothetical protein OHK0056_33120 [Bacteriovoracaceae bacterium]